MPRTGGVFSLLSGSKGSPNTTIQSSPYNSQLDDFAQDANLARPVTAGGTGATTAGGARTNLGLVPGTDVQAFDAGLLSIAGLTTAANQMIYTTALDVYATTALTPFARTILDDADAATVRATLGLGASSTFNTVPVANGGTGATDAATARTNLGLATVASSGSASDLTAGTIADARLPGTMSGKVFTGITVFNPSSGTASNIVADGANGSLELYSAAPYIDFKNAAADDFDARIQLSGGTTLAFSSLAASMQHNGQVIWTAGNHGPGSGLNADLLDGQHGAFYQNASNLNAGTISDSRLPSTQTGKVFTSDIEVRGISIELGRQDGVSSPAYIDFHTSAAQVDYNARIIVTGNVGQSAGSIELIGGSLTFNGQDIWNAASLAPISQAEAQAGTATTNRAWTAQRVAQAIAAQAQKLPFTSGQQTVTLGASASIAHGLGVVPSNVTVDLICATAEQGYSVGNIIQYGVHTIGISGVGGVGGTFIIKDITNITLMFPQTQMWVLNKSTGVQVVITPANWRAIVRAYP